MQHLVVSIGISLMQGHLKSGAFQQHIFFRPEGMTSPTKMIKIERNVNIISRARTN